ncbi:MAG: protoporphyrinogen oxidase [Candidatus Hydrogenedentes bacterium]|nr:protoporphyrinogen oxidase [Candidatus Hydrogenedentota bacterium]
MRYECKALVLGGGITGLCAAHYLSEFFGRTRVLLLEAANATGGAARTDIVDGFCLDWGPNGFLDREPLTLKWIDELGLSGELVRADESAARRFILKNNALIEIRKPPAFLLSPLLSLSGRLRLMREPLVSRKRGNDPETVWSFAARRLGPEAADTLVSCMASGVYGGDAKELSMVDCFPRIAALEREYGSLLRGMFAKKRNSRAGDSMGPGGVLTSFRRGMGYLAEASSNTLGDRVLIADAAQTIERIGSSYQIKTGQGHSINAEYVVVTIPAFRAAALLASLDGEAATNLEAIPYAGITVVCSAYTRQQVDHPLGGFGYLVPKREGKRTLGCLWTSSIFPHEAPADHVLIRTMIGGATDPSALELDHEQLMDVVRNEVHSLLRISGAPLLTQVFRHARGIPQYTLGHGGRLAAIEAAENRNPGLVFAGNAYRGVGLNDCVVSAVRAVERVVFRDSTHAQA